MKRIGQQFGNYRLTHRIGHGGTAKVYQGEHVELPSRKVAIKILKTDIDDPVSKKNFLHEVKVLARLQHPNVIRIIDFGIEDTEPYIIMDLAPSGNLGQIPLESLTKEKLCSYTKQIANALYYAHQNHQIVHCDLKPQNVFVGRDGTLMVGDFGYASVQRSTQQHSSTPEGGTWEYTAPEQIDPKRFGKPGPASDQYALGIMVYQLA